MIEENKYNELRKSLKSLPDIKAGKEFDTKLFQKIKLVDRETLAHQLSEKYSVRKIKWYQNVFRPWLIPAAGVAVILIVSIILVFYYLPSDKKTANNEKSPGINLFDKKVPDLETKQKEITALPNDESIKNDKSVESLSPTKSIDGMLKSTDDDKTGYREPMDEIDTKITPSEKEIYQEVSPIMGPKKESDKLEEKISKEPSKSKEDIPSKSDDVKDERMKKTEKNEKKVESITPAPKSEDSIKVKNKKDAKSGKDKSGDSINSQIKIIEEKPDSTKK
jgi:hypothetical protein